MATLNSPPKDSGFDVGNFWLAVTIGHEEPLDDIEHITTGFLQSTLTVHAVKPSQLASQGGGPGWLTLNGNGVTHEQAERFLELTRKAAIELDKDLVDTEPGVESKDMKSKRTRFLNDAVSSKVQPMPPVRELLYQAFGDELTRQWDVLKQSVFADPSQAFAGMQFQSAAAAKAAVDARFPLRPNQSAAVVPGEGIDFCLGEPGRRLIHTDQVESDFPELNQIAGVGVLVRRGSDMTSIGPWRLVTAGVPVVGEADGLFEGAGDWLSEMHPAPLTSAFLNNLLSTDYVYRGAPMRTADPLHCVHDRRLVTANTKLPNTFVPFSLQSAGALPAGAVAHAGACKAPPLRYGDTYQIAAFLIDRTGAMPDELCGANPWEMDFQKVAVAVPPRMDTVVFRRRVVPGPVSFSCQATKTWP
jgi:hypothetical protein